MSTITLTRCSGGNHVTVEVKNDKGETVDKFDRDYADLDPEAVKESEPEDVREDAVKFIKDEISKADAKTFEEMKQAVEGKALPEKGGV